MTSPRAHSQLCVRFGSNQSLGIGKLQLLEAISGLGSISAAARSMDMAYRHAWEIDDLKLCFGDKVVSTSSGGSQGGGAELTPLGRELVDRSRTIAEKAVRSLAADLRRLERRLRIDASD